MTLTVVTLITLVVGAMLSLLLSPLQLALATLAVISATVASAHALPVAHILGYAVCTWVCVNAGYFLGTSIRTYVAPVATKSRETNLPER